MDLGMRFDDVRYQPESREGISVKLQSRIEWNRQYPP
jgi:hypothetical protein